MDACLRALIPQSYKLHQLTCSGVNLTGFGPGVSMTPHSVKKICKSVDCPRCDLCGVDLVMVELVAYERTAHSW